MFNTDEFDALFDDASESSDMFSGLFSENINPDTEKVTDPNEIVKGGDVDPDGTEPDVKSSFESLFEDDDDSAEGEDSEGEADDVDGDSEDLDSDLFENFIL